MPTEEPSAIMATKHLATSQLLALMKARKIPVPKSDYGPGDDSKQRHDDLVSACQSAGLVELTRAELATLQPAKYKAGLRTPVFRNGDTVRVSDGHAVHLKSNLHVALLPVGPPPQALQRVSLRGIQERVGELIDLSTHCEPRVTGGACFFNNPEAGDPIFLQQDGDVR